MSRSGSLASWSVGPGQVALNPTLLGTLWGEADGVAAQSDSALAGLAVSTV